jgi:hypothetical protein
MYRSESFIGQRSKRISIHLQLFMICKQKQGMMQQSPLKLEASFCQYTKILSLVNLIQQN